MLTILAFGMVIVFMTLLVTRKLSPLTALILVPMGLDERTRLAATHCVQAVHDTVSVGAGTLSHMRRPALLPVNVALIVMLMLALVVGILPLPVLFMIAFAIAIMINYPSVSEQKRLLATHAANAMAVASLIFAAGIFTGILSGMRMVDAMAETVVQHLPDALGP